MHRSILALAALGIACAKIPAPTATRADDASSDGADTDEDDPVSLTEAWAAAGRADAPQAPPRETPEPEAPQSEPAEPEAPPREADEPKAPPSESDEPPPRETDAPVADQAEARGLNRADAVPTVKGGYEKVPTQWDEARIYIDDRVDEAAKACLRDPNTILAQFAFEGAETIYTVSLRHPPMITASSEGFVDESDWMRAETDADAAVYEAKFGTDRDDFRAKRVRIEAPRKLRPCR